MNKAQFQNSKYKSRLKELVKTAEALRSHDTDPIDISFEEVLKETCNLSMDALYQDLGIDRSSDTISNLFTYGTAEDVRWLVPEIFREAVKLGMSQAPIYPNITVQDVTVKNLKTIMPYINESDAAPRRLGEAETIPLGTISYGDKLVTVYKMGRGISIPDEVKNFVSLDVVSLFIADFGKKIGRGLDVLALDCLINGDQADGSTASPVIGTTTGVASTKAYKDFLRIWIRGSRIGRSYDTIIGGEDIALTTLDLADFKTPQGAGSVRHQLNLKTPVPASSNYFIHGNIPANKELLVDSSAALLKLTAVPLKTESERIVSNQTEAWYITTTTGFGKLFTDASLILSAAETIGSKPFPSSMDPTLFENQVIA